MENKIKFSIKVCGSEDKNLESLQSALSKKHNIYPGKYMKNNRISGECKELDLDKIRDYSLKENIEINLICYSVEKRIAVLTELKYGYIVSRKVLDFNKEIKDELLEEKFNKISEDSPSSTSFSS